MDLSEKNPKTKHIESLDDHILRYHYAEMLVEAQVEFDASLTSRELIDQDSIAKIFRKGKDDERN